MSTLTLTAAQIAELVKGQLHGNGAAAVTGVASLREAAPELASFISNKKYQDQLHDTRAKVVLVCPDFAGDDPGEKTYVVCENVDYAFTVLAGAFAPPPIEYPRTIHPSAVVDPTAKIGKNVHVGANAVIEAGAEIGDDTVIEALCYVGHNARVGRSCHLYPHVSIMYRCTLGDLVVLHPGVVIGGDGFGFVPGPKGLVKVPQTGIVQIGNDVEIGANTTVDRARFGKTIIKDNAKIDNQVMVAHNVIIGESSILVAQCGVAGSAEIGRGVILAAKSGVNGHITVGDGVKLAGTSSLAKSTPAGAVMLGTPAEPQREFMARLTLPKRFEKLSAKVKELEEKLKKLAE